DRRLSVDQVRDEADTGSIVERDHDHRVGHVGGELGEECAVHRGVGEDLTAARDPDPLVREAPALPAHGGGKMPKCPAARAALDKGLARATAFPEGTGVVGDGGEGHLGWKVGSTHRTHRRRRSALVGIPLPLATRASSASGTWLTATPRSCFTASTTWLSPWMYASERLPPAVLVGSAPPGQERSPAAAKWPLSPRWQMPKSSSWSSTIPV